MHNSLKMRQALVEALGPWAVAGPSRTVARLALEDSVWQDAARRQLAIDSQRLAALLAEFVAGAAPVRHPLFVWLATAEASSLADRLARRGILVRHFDSPECGGLRVGLPGTPEQWQRLLAALKVLS